MKKNIYIVRHCKAGCQEVEAALTAAGEKQAEDLAAFLSGERIERIVCSHFLRAQQSIAPLAVVLGIEVEIDERLGERVLSAEPLADWQTALRQSFADLDWRLEGGESARAVLERVEEVLRSACAAQAERVVLVSHGNLIALLLHWLDGRDGFASNMALTNPDVFRVEVDGGHVSIERVWRS